MVNVPGQEDVLWLLGEIYVMRESLTGTQNPPEGGQRKKKEKG